jgi:hypothetical protein
MKSFEALCCIALQSDKETLAIAPANIEKEFASLRNVLSTGDFL